MNGKNATITCANGGELTPELTCYCVEGWFGTLCDKTLTQVMHGWPLLWIISVALWVPTLIALLATIVRRGKYWDDKGKIFWSAAFTVASYLGEAILLYFKQPREIVYLVGWGKYYAGPQCGMLVSFVWLYSYQSMGKGPPFSKPTALKGTFVLCFVGGWIVPYAMIVLFNETTSMRVAAGYGIVVCAVMAFINFRYGLPTAAAIAGSHPVLAKKFRILSLVLTGLCANLVTTYTALAVSPLVRFSVVWMVMCVLYIQTWTSLSAVLIYTAGGTGASRTKVHAAGGPSNVISNVASVTAVTGNSRQHTSVAQQPPV